MFDWTKLLSTTRVRDLFDGDASVRVPGDLRTAFDQDFGRAVFSTPVRRLQDKAQVFPLEPHDSIRTRLTHSNEVSSIARGLGSAVESFLMKDKQENKIPYGTIPTIAATCGLIHDIGNPPFGHAGEKAIASWFEKRLSLFEEFPGETLDLKLESQFAKDFLKFEGNAQTQRLLSSLQMLADRFGLNMTCGTLSASLKYVVPSHRTDPNRAEAKKHGYFASENDLINRIQNEVGTGEARHPIAFLVEAADDIAYATVDLEDGIKKGCLDWAFLKAELLRRAPGPVLDQVLKSAEDKIQPARNLTGKAKDEALAVAFRTYGIIHMANASIGAFKAHYEPIMSGAHSKSLLKSSEIAPLVKACKDIAGDHVYTAPQIIKLEIMGRKVIWDLLDIYWEAAQFVLKRIDMPPFAERIYALISKNYREICEEGIKSAAPLIPDEYLRMQLITDQVCGMTDSYAVNLHRELTNGI